VELNQLGLATKVTREEDSELKEIKAKLRRQLVAKKERNKTKGNS
jgi:hypothetical protein